VDEVARADAMFSAGSTGRTLVDACAAVGLPAGGAELMRLGENAIYRLRDAPVVVRIARTARFLATVRREVAAARWLASAGLPTARVVELQGCQSMAAGRKPPVVVIEAAVVAVATGPVATSSAAPSSAAALVFSSTVVGLVG
jgi:Ser/Thr protein kinase RdoA (MazF antagonist)